MSTSSQPPKSETTSTGTTSSTGSTSAPSRDRILLRSSNDENLEKERQYLEQTLREVEAEQHRRQYREARKKLIRALENEDLRFEIDLNVSSIRVWIHVSEAVWETL
jgi:hypothetical protein